MIYLASPYSYPDPQVRQWRYEQTLHFTWCHMQLGRIIFSPIVYGHHFAERHGAEYNAAAWSNFNFELVSICTELWILRLPGWERSTGVALERGWANHYLLPVTEKDPLPDATL